MKVKTIPNPFRPGVGHEPKSTSSRPSLPQHARHCPVLEAGSALGFLVYPALLDTETYEVTRTTPSQYRLTLYEGPKGGVAEPLFSAMYSVVMGATSAREDEIVMHRQVAGLDDKAVEMLIQALIVPTHFGTPTGGVGLRGSTFFRTEEGWDTVFTSILNHVDPPVVPMLSVRVETDWFSQDTEFRYILQPGDVMQISASTPIGQVFFIPREETVLEDATPQDIANFHRSAAEFQASKAPHQTASPFGMSFSPYYKQQQKGRS